MIDDGWVVDPSPASGTSLYTKTLNDVMLPGCAAVGKTLWYMA